jgi:methylmalonyl-CoA mutase
MTDSAARDDLSNYCPKHRPRLITAASLFDGHDASINIMRRILQSMGAEVIHLGHNRSVDEIVTAALDEDAHGIAVSSYQGGHNEFFQYMVDLLRQRDGSEIKIFGGGGGVILPCEIDSLQSYGVTRIFSPQDGQRMGLQGMIGWMLAACDHDWTDRLTQSLDAFEHSDLTKRWRALSRMISALEDGSCEADLLQAMRSKAANQQVPVLGITGTGGAGKSSLTDELIRRLRLDQGDLHRIAVISIDPTRRRSGGALLGDRIRMNAIGPWPQLAQQFVGDPVEPSRKLQEANRVYMRSLATRQAGTEVSAALADTIAACKCAGFDLVLVETSGIGQGDAAIVSHVDLSLYVMTPEYGAASQLEKIDMLDLADLVVINKFDRLGAADALRDVSKQVQRNRNWFDRSVEQMPVFGTTASRFNDDGVTALYFSLLPRLGQLGLKIGPSRLSPVSTRHSTDQTRIVPPDRNRYLAEISHTIRQYKQRAQQQSQLATQRQQLMAAAQMLATECGQTNDSLQELIRIRQQRLDGESQRLLESWQPLQESYSGQQQVVKIRDQEVCTQLTHRTLSGNLIPRIALPKFQDHGDQLRWLMLENVPGVFPYTAGVFPFKRPDEEPTRMFAGEGDAFRTNRRFKMLSASMPAKRLSTAFDSVTLYGNNPDLRPDIFGKVGNSGVSIATLDDMRALYDGFDLTAPTTSVSMTINGPAPTILAMFLNTAIDKNIEKFVTQHGRQANAQEIAQIRAWTLENIRGTVQADILKEDQGQNTCIFSTEFSLKVMGDIQQFFVQHNVRNFYSVSISGYHIAEAGANPISQLAFTLANGFTYVEAYLARGMPIDDFAPNLSFFFSNGMDPEYTVMGRVARRIWAVAMRERYGANARSQKLKYHCQTSGRSLHAQEIAFNDIRTTLQALIATYDHANSLHTNAYDEAITTPTEESVRRAMAIQLIINREWGLAKNENSNQGSFVIEQLTELVEEAVLKEFEAISSRGGVLGAMELGYQRSRIQEESLHYEHLKHTGELPIVGVNTFRNPGQEDAPHAIELARSSEEEKRSQLRRLEEFHTTHAVNAPQMLKRLQQAVIDRQNVFDVLMEAVRCCSLGQITEALFSVGGQYRRSM